MKLAPLHMNQLKPPTNKYNLLRHHAVDAPKHLEANPSAKLEKKIGGRPQLHCSTAARPSPSQIDAITESQSLTPQPLLFLPNHTTRELNAGFRPVLCLLLRAIRRLRTRSMADWLGACPSSSRRDLT